jgi:hypothetical protein
MLVDAMLAADAYGQNAAPCWPAKLRYPKWRSKEKTPRAALLEPPPAIG